MMKVCLLEDGALSPFGEIKILCLASHGVLMCIANLFISLFIMFSLLLLKPNLADYATLNFMLQFSA
jgi:hypothetical protein